MMIDDRFDHYFRELYSIEKEESQDDYLLFHRDRYKYLMGEVGRYIPEGSPRKEFRILDIGPAYQTYLVRSIFDVKVNTLGYDHPINHRGAEEHHFQVNLNFASRFKGSAIPHDLIIFSEVIEHLFTPADDILSFILLFLKPGGYIILQTPNAVCTFKRLKMLVGHNPYELLRKTRDGHFREYTVPELSRFFTDLDLTVVKADLRNYFNYPENYQKVYRAINFFMPKNLKDGITIVGRKPD